MILKTLANRCDTAGTEALGMGIILTIYLTLKPLYLFASGLPQISDMFMIAAAVYMLVKERGIIRIPKGSGTWIRVFVLTLVFQCAIQLFWWVKTDESEFLLVASYYVFNFIAALLCVCIGRRIGPKRLKRAICEGCFWSVLVNAVGLAVNLEAGVRMKGFFNNPNQLGYYSLLAISIIAFFPDQLPKWKNGMILGLAVWANMVSLSKAAILGLAGLAFCYTLWGSREKTLRRALTQAFFLLAFFGAIYWLFFSDSSIVKESKTLSQLQSRILNLREENDSSLGIGRGYDRVWEIGGYFLWGVGEGAYDRFQVMSGREVHATLVNVLVSYGAAGFVAYLWLMGKTMLFRGSRMRNLACFSGLFLYSLTHNGIRNTILWILLAAVLQTTGPGAEAPEPEEAAEQPAENMIRKGRSYESQNFG